MRDYILKRVFEMFAALLIMSVIVFLLARMTGDPVALLLSEYASEQEKQVFSKGLPPV